MVIGTDCCYDMKYWHLFILVVTVTIDDSMQCFFFTTWYTLILVYVSVVTLCC